MIEGVLTSLKRIRRRQREQHQERTAATNQPAFLQQARDFESSRSPRDVHVNRRLRSQKRPASVGKQPKKPNCQGSQGCNAQSCCCRTHPCCSGSKGCG